MVQLIKNLVFSTFAVFRMYFNYSGKNYRESALLSEIVRNVHSIEKGMCIRNPRMMYGLKKINYLMQIVEEYLQSGFSKDRDELKMVCGALDAYVNFHEERNCNNIDLQRIREYCDSLKKKVDIEADCSAYGGCVWIKNTQHAENHTLKQLLDQRHSIREFAAKEVDEKDILKAVEMANRCPSACNRQTTRVYIIDKARMCKIKEWLAGIGGFVDDVDKFLIITGKTSAFNVGEVYQHIVNAGIFTGTLTLCLNDLGIGSCVVQRPLLSTPTWRRFARDNNIPGDEEIVCMIAIGIPAEEYQVPLSYRLNANTFVRRL